MFYFFMHGISQWEKVASATAYHFWLDVASCASLPIRLQDPLSVCFSGKIWDYTFWLDLARCTSHLIRLQDSLISNISGRSHWFLRFFVWEKWSRKVLASETTSFSGFFRVCLSSNQTSGFFEHQYLRKESIDIMDFLHGNNHQGKVAS